MSRLFRHIGETRRFLTDKKYIVRLVDGEREQLNQIVKKFSGSNEKVRRAQILLKADANVRQTPKKQNNRNIEYWVIPPECDAEFAACEKVTLVCDNLNTHTRSAFYEVFEPSRARALVKRIDWC